MSSIRRKPNSKYWYACYDQADGTRTQVSTKTTDRKAAIRIAQEYEDSVREAKLGFLVEATARKHISRIYKTAVGAEIKFFSIEEWLDFWSENKIKSKRKTTAQRYLSSMKKFLSVMGKRSELDINHLLPTDAENFRNHLIKSGKSNRSINLEIKVISSAFNQACMQRYMKINPFQSLDSLPVQDGAKKNFSKKDVEIILKYSRGDWYGLILFGYYTGARISDLTQMKWSNLDLKKENPVARLSEIKKQDKHKRELVVPLHPMVMKWVTSTAKGSGNEYLFPSLQPLGTGGNKGLSQSFKRILLKAGIVEELYQKKKEGSVGRTVSPYSFHSLRHSFKTELANKGVAADVRDVLSGHAKPSVAEAYVHRDTSVLMDAIRLLPDLKVA